MSQNRWPLVRVLAAALPVLLACAGLGAFGSCNLDMVRTARGGTQFGSGALLIGGGIGLLIGLVAFCWDTSWTKQPSPRWRRFALQSGYAGVWLLVAVLSFSADLTHAFNWMPVRIPFRFDKANTVSAAFTADMSATYYIQIDLKRKLPVEDLIAFTEPLSDTDKPPHKGPPRPEIVWKVTPVDEEGQSTDWRGTSEGDKLSLIIGRFKTVAGQRYTTTVQVVKPSPAVQILDPHLEIKSWPFFMSPFYTAAITARMGGLIAGMIGLILMIYALVLLQTERRKNKITVG